METVINKMQYLQLKNCLLKGFKYKGPFVSTLGTAYEFGYNEPRINQANFFASKSLTAMINFLLS